LASHVDWGDSEEFWIFLAAMLGLYAWSHLSTGHRIGKKLQPFVDEFFDVTPSSKRENKGNPPSKPKANQ
jgi:hypothetical protein